MNQYKQLVLSSGDQVILEPLEWQIDELEMAAINIFQIISVRDEGGHPLVHLMEPWIPDQIGPDHISTIQTNHIIAISNPTEDTTNAYIASIQYYLDRKDIGEESSGEIINLTEDTLH